VTEFTPINKLESSILLAKTGQLPMQDLLQTLLRSDVAVPSGAVVAPDGAGFQPLLFKKDGVEMIALFTAKSRMKDFAAVAPYVLEIKGAEFLKRLPKDCGVVVNPGLTEGFDISPAGLAKILDEFGKA
jgi:hypothetical protein